MDRLDLADSSSNGRALTILSAASPNTAPLRTKYGPLVGAVEHENSLLCAISAFSAPRRL